MLLNGKTGHIVSCHSYNSHSLCPTIAWSSVVDVLLTALFNLILIMENTEWIKGLLGKKRVFNKKIEFVHNTCFDAGHTGQILRFDSEEEWEEYLQVYWQNLCEKS